MPHPGSYRSALSTGLAAGVVLSSVWVRVQAGKGIRNTYDSSFFLVVTGFNRLGRPLVRRLERDMPAKRRATPNNEYL